MKIALTTSGKDLSAPVDPRFGRAARFLLYDTETGNYESLDNSQALESVQGAGIQAAEQVARMGAQYVITGHCGPKAFRALQAAGIQVMVGVEGSAAEAIELFTSGKLKPAQSADVEGHW